MSRLDELIKERCPEGIPYLQISDVTKYEQPSKYIVKSTKYDDSYSTPVLTAGQTFILGYTDEIDGIYEASKENPVIIFDDFTAALKWVDFPFKVKSSAMKIITADEKQISLRYLYYIMDNIGYSSSEHKRLWISTYSGLKIPVPPLDVQNEIVQILDNFAELTAELTAELSNRKKQYEYYRDLLLNFSKNEERGVRWVSIEDICEISRGYVMSKDFIRNNAGEYPVYSSQTENNGMLGRINSYRYDGEYLTWTTDGANAGTVFRRSGKFSVTNVCGLLKVTDPTVSIDYLYYILSNTAKRYVNSGMGNPKLMSNVMARIKVPIPDNKEQQRIVDVLDRFDKLTSDISEGLPAEIEARGKQYAYYRDKLLSFKELETEMKNA